MTLEMVRPQVVRRDIEMELKRLEALRTVREVR
jgi:hypothetical protein